uniref:Polyprotein protein n=1 Tax=Solanum tuberosum TaxID=4113 RepID=M1DPF7_SOLTU
MIESDMAVALVPLHAFIDTLTLRVTSCESRQGLQSKITALRADIVGLHQDVDYLMSVDFNNLMRMADEGGSPANSIPPTTTRDEDLAAAQEREEEDSIFGNLSSLVENVVQLATKTLPTETPTAALTGLGTAALAEVTPGTDAHTQTADQRIDVPIGGEPT